MRSGLNLLLGFASSGVVRCCELQLLGLTLSMLAAEVPVDLADEDSTIFVADPASDRHVIDSAHDAVADEGVSGVMKPKARQLGILAREQK